MGNKTGTEILDLSPERAIALLWEAGNLTYKLKGNQIKVKEAFVNAPNDQESHTVLCSRRFGKTFVLCCWAIETALQIPNAIVKYACPTQDQAREIIEDIISNFILHDCPEHLRPYWHVRKKGFVFKNGSIIRVAGTDKDQGKSLRGGRGNLCIVDEAQDHKHLTYIVDSVLSPTLDTTNGKIVLAGTPNPKEPNHPFHTDYIFPLQSTGKLISFNVYQSPKYEEEGEKFIQTLENRYKSKGGLKSAAFLCEYMCQIAVDEETFVVPEARMVSLNQWVKEVERPEYYDHYQAMDIGSVHLNPCIFGYYDFLENRIVIEYEFVPSKDPTSVMIAEGIKKTEAEAKYKGRPWLRVADNNNQILLRDLCSEHGIVFLATEKHNKVEFLNKLRVLFSEGRIVVHPRCVHLIYHLQNAKWKDKNKKEFALLKDSPDKKLRGGHADFVDALIYFVRNIAYSHNPYPDKVEKDEVNFTKTVSKAADFMNKLMGRK